MLGQMLDRVGGVLGLDQVEVAQMMGRVYHDTVGQPEIGEVHAVRVVAQRRVKVTVGHVGAERVRDAQRPLGVAPHLEHALGRV